MTKTFSYTLVNAGQFYNLWNDMIATFPGFDPAFTNFPYFPSEVGQLEIQSDSVNVGKIIAVWSDLAHRGNGITKAAGLSYEKRSSINNIPLKTHFVRTDVAGAVINVTIASN